jgi:hypothetical protein
MKKGQNVLIHAVGHAKPSNIDCILISRREHLVLEWLLSN